MENLKISMWDIVHKEIYFPDEICYIDGKISDKLFPNNIPLFFIGHTDKYGNDLYGGDIVFYQEPIETFLPTLAISVIEWCDKKTGFKLSKYSAEYYNWSKMIKLGNIFENPGLLEICTNCNCFRNCSTHITDDTKTVCSYYLKLIEEKTK